MAQFPSEQSESGEFERQEDEFRSRIGKEHPVEAGRYHLYVSLACPWAHRTLIVRHRKGLETAVSSSVVDPVRDERGWAFRKGPGHAPDPVNGFSFLSEAYRATDPAFEGRVTVPVLWDKQAGVILNNSEDDICRMFNDDFSTLANEPTPDLFPADLEKEQAELSQFIYERINNGVYRAGFATKQESYEKAVSILFEALDELENRLIGGGPFLFGERIVESDWRLFCTLIRFDPVYHGHFKCNIRRIVDYPALQRYLSTLYHQPGISETVNFDHIKRHYYITHDDLNPSGIVPLGPKMDL
jgi:glutathionyl-hydroquinone reductase